MQRSSGRGKGGGGGGEEEEEVEAESDGDDADGDGGGDDRESDAAVAGACSPSTESTLTRTKLACALMTWPRIFSGAPSGTMNEGASRCCCRSREAEAATAIERRASAMAFEKKREPRSRQPNASTPELASSHRCSRDAKTVTATRLLGEETRSLRMASARGADIGAAKGEPPRFRPPRARALPPAPPRLASLPLAPLPLLLPAAAAADAGLEEALIVFFDRERREERKEKREKAKSERRPRERERCFLGGGNVMRFFYKNNKSKARKKNLSLLPSPELERREARPELRALFLSDQELDRIPSVRLPGGGG